MKILMFLLVFLPCIAQAAEILQEKGGDGAMPHHNCMVEVQFGSRCCGIDLQTYEKILAVVKKSTIITKAEERHYGREGERSFCLSMEEKDKKAVYDELNALIIPTPPHSSVGGTTITQQ